MIPADPIETRGDHRCHVRIHLANGTQLDVHIDDQPEKDVDEIAQEMADKLEKRGRPGWLRLDSTVVYTGAVSAFEVLG